MKHQFLKAAAVSPDLKVADPAYNAAQIIQTIQAHAEKGTELLVFPELSLSGYTCGDLFFQSALLDGCLAALEEVAAATKDKKMLVYVGLPVAYGDKIYNCAAAISDGKVLSFTAKTYLPNYGEFYEQRHFTSGRGLDGYVSLKDGAASISAHSIVYDKEHNVYVACEICEDIWTASPPSIEHCRHGATVIVNLSASNELVGKRERRHGILSSHSRKNICAYVYCSAGMGESTSDMVFGGNNMIYENGNCLAETKPFTDDPCEAEIDIGYLISSRRRTTSFAVSLGDSPEDPLYRWAPASFVTENELSLRDVDPTPFVPHDDGERRERAELILNMQAHALAQRLKIVHAKTAVIGVSGGLDSTLALLVVCRAFDLLKKSRDDILAVTMPGFGTSAKTKNNAVVLMQALGVSVRKIPISRTVLSHFKDIGHDPDDTNTTYENAQARYRMMVLMDLANETGGLVIGTGDLSELALGWCTYNGDHMSMYSVNSSIPKTLVKYLVLAEAQMLGGRAEAVLMSILGTAISPELLPTDEKGEISQKTEDLIGPYELTDFYLYHMLRREESPAKILYLAKIAFKGQYEEATLKKWLVNFYRRFFSQQFKRNCLPDGVKVGPVSLSPRSDWRMPSDASAALWLEEAEKL